MATPFSPYVGRRPKVVVKRRQSELPSDLIDWDAPEIPELEKQKIVYEDYIKELKEDNEIETVLSEQIFKVAHDTVVDQYQTKLKALEDEVTKERSKVNLMLGQIKMFEGNVKEDLNRIEELENTIATQQEVINCLEQEREDWVEERSSLQMEIENLNFKINESTCELNYQREMHLASRVEVDECKKRIHTLKLRLAHMTNLAKNEDNEE